MSDDCALHSRPNAVPLDEVAVALNAIPRPHPTDPTIIQYERNGTVIAWHRVAVLREHLKEKP